MQPIDSGEFLRDREWRPMMVRGRAHNPVNDFTFGDAVENLCVTLAGQAPIIAAHQHAALVRIHECRCPLDRMDFRQKCRVDEPGFLEKPFAGLLGMINCQPVNDRIVLAREQRVKGREADPPVSIDARKFEARLLLLALRVKREMPVFIQPKFSVLQKITGVRVCSQPIANVFAGPIDLRGVPPVRFNVAIGRRAAFVARTGVRIWFGRRYLHRTVRPVIVVGNRDVEQIVLVVGPVAQPVVDHELDPGSREHVQMRHRLEGLTRKQLV